MKRKKIKPNGALSWYSAQYAKPTAQPNSSSCALSRFCGHRRVGPVCLPLSRAESRTFHCRVGPICRSVSVFLAWPVLFLLNSTRAARDYCKQTGRDRRSAPLLGLSPTLALKSCDLILSAVLAGILIWAAHLNRCGEIRGELPGQNFPRPRVPCAHINRRPYSYRAPKPPSSASAIDKVTRRYPLS